MSATGAMHAERLRLAIADIRGRRRHAAGVRRDFSGILFPPDFPPNSSLQGGKWRNWMVGDLAKTPDFSGRNGTAKYRTRWAATV